MGKLGQAVAKVGSARRDHRNCLHGKALKPWQTFKTHLGAHSRVSEVAAQKHAQAALSREPAQQPVTHAHAQHRHPRTLHDALCCGSERRLGRPHKPQNEHVCEPAFGGFHQGVCDCPCRELGCDRDVDVSP